MKEEVRIPSLPKRKAEAHKGDFGHTLILAGSPRMTGAALLATRAALRSGSGLVTLGVPAPLHALIAPSMLSAMSLPLPATPMGTFSREAMDIALDFASAASAVALGPGISTEGETVAFALGFSLRARVPLVLDADGLNGLAQTPKSFRAAPAPRVLTPHPGEAARLLGQTPDRIQADRPAAAAALVKKFSTTVVLKGHQTVVADKESFYVNQTGNPGMATGGSGDVLTGIIAAFLARGLSAFDAAVLGVYVHGLAGDLAAKDLGEEAMIAADLLDHLPAALRRVPRC
ncbi:MAG: NAD(P)H-hydrate dehydratase [Planctomycetota bacterium]